MNCSIFPENFQAPYYELLKEITLHGLLNCEKEVRGNEYTILTAIIRGSSFHNSNIAGLRLHAFVNYHPVNGHFTFGLSSTTTTLYVSLSMIFISWDATLGAYSDNGVLMVRIRSFTQFPYKKSYWDSTSHLDSAKDFSMHYSYTAWVTLSQLTVEFTCLNGGTKLWEPADFANIFQILCRQILDPLASSSTHSIH